MADPNKFKSVYVPNKTYKMLEFLEKDKFVDANLTISKTIKVLQLKEQKNRVSKKNKDFCQINYKPGSVI